MDAPNPSDSGRFEPGTLLAGRYRIVAQVGRGAMGQVFHAHDLELGESVALKLLPEDGHLDDGIPPAKLEQLRDEVKVARRISHPNICRVYDLADHDGLRFITMEYLPGEDLKTQLERLDRPVLPKAIDLAMQLCEALTAMHDRGVLHRDIKPSNIMVDRDGVLRLMDFGLAGLIGSGAGGGSPAYRAPELWDDGPPTVATDLYAAGLVLYELFVGQRTFHSKSIQEMAWMHGQTSPVPPSQLVESIDPRHEAVILRCLAKDPADRPTSAEEIRRVFDPSTEIAGWRPEVDLEIPSRQHWRLQRKLGEGGFGEVWLAEREKTRERRVFKFCFDAVNLASLQREITLFRLLKEALGDREDINRILDWRLDEAPFFIESEYTDAGSLRDWIEAQGGCEHVPLAIRLEIVAQVSDALAAAHTVGVLHKDVKPANILIRLDAAGVAKAQLADFGIGTITERERLEQVGVTALGLTATAESHSAGTRLYMAPEILEGQIPRVQSDIYSLGVVLYQLVVGDLNRSLASGWQRDITDPFLVEDISSAVDGRPSSRLADAHQLAIRLRNLEQRHEDAAVRRRDEENAERMAESLRKSQRRRRLWLGATATLALVALSNGFLLHRVSQEAVRATAEAERARAESEERQQVVGFLENLFENADPFHRESRVADSTVGDLLDRGTKRLEEFQQYPGTQARLLHTLGRVYTSLGTYDRARELLEESLTLRRELLGGDPVDVAESLFELSRLHYLTGDYGVAESWVREALDIQRQALGDQHLAVAESSNILANILFAKGDYGAAETLYQETLDIQRQHPEADPSNITRALNNLAIILSIQGDLQGAEAMAQEALENQRRVSGDRHPHIVTSMNFLAYVLGSRGDHGAAEAMARDAMAIGQDIFGDVHPAVATSWNNLAFVFSAKGEHGSAATAIREALAIQRQLYKPQHPEIAGSLNNLAYMLAQDGNFEESEPLARESLDIKRQLYGDEHPGVATTMETLAGILVGRKDFASAEPMARQALDMQRRFLGDENPELAQFATTLARVHEGQRDFSAAEPLFLEALEIRRRLLGNEHPETRQALGELERFYGVAGRPQEAQKYRDPMPHDP